MPSNNKPKGTITAAQLQSWALLGGFRTALVAEIYHHGWAIELFFRWFKCVLGRASQWHWFAESEQGVALQMATRPPSPRWR